MPVVGKGEEVAATVMAKFPAGAAVGWEGNRQRGRRKNSLG